jgi:C1A family cysteine protease
MEKTHDEMKQFIYDFGPVFVAFDVYDSFFNYRGGVYNGCYGNRNGGHAVLITGFGEENGVKYWIAKNSWGECSG